MLKRTFFLSLVLAGCFNANVFASPKNYSECLESGGKLLKTYPGQCVAENGEIFVDQKAGEASEKATEKSCIDLCGDKICQEMVCMAIGCPCSETGASCPEDCKLNSN